MHAETESPFGTGSAFTTGPVGPISGAVPMMPVTNAGNGRRQVTIEECRIAGHTGDPRVALGRVSVIDALLLTSEEARLRARVIVTPPSQQTTVVDMVAVDAHRFRAPFVPIELGSHQVRIEAWVDHPSMWLDQALDRVAQGTAGGLTLQRGSSILFGASLRAGHGDREVLAFASKLLETADHPQLLQSEHIRNAVEMAGRYPDVEMVTVETSWHDVLVQPAHAATGAWCVVPGPSDATGGVASLGAALERAAQLGFDVLCVDLTGADGGMTAPDPAQADAWRDLAERARSRGVHLGVRLGMRCGPGHPWRAEVPWWFRGNGTAADLTGPTDGGDLDFETQDWGSLWHAVEALWQSWLELGVDAFVVHEPQRAPIRFWDWLLPTLRRRQLQLVVGCTGLDDPLVARRLGVGGLDLAFVACDAAGWPQPPGPGSLLEDLGRQHGGEPSQARVGRWVPATGGTAADRLRALLYAGLSGPSYAMEVAPSDLLGGSTDAFDVLVHLHAWRRGAGGALSPVASLGSEHLVVLAAEDGPDRAVLMPAGADRDEARSLLDRLPWPGSGWLDVLAGCVVDADHLLPDDALPARLLVPLPPA